MKLVNRVTGLELSSLYTERFILSGENEFICTTNLLIGYRSEISRLVNLVSLKGFLIKLYNISILYG